MDNQWSPDRWRKSSSMKEKGQDKQTKVDQENFEKTSFKKPPLISIFWEILEDTASIKPEQHTLKKEK